MRCRDCGEYVDAKFQKIHNCHQLSFRELFRAHKKAWVIWGVGFTIWNVYWFINWVS